MKRSVVVCLMTMILTGCATSPIIGPFSYMTSKSNQKAIIRRSAIIDAKMVPEKKAAVFKATMFTTRPNEVAMAAGVDVMALINAEYTWGEIGKQLLGVGGDLVLYGVAGYGISEISGGSNSDSRSGGINVDGNNNTINATQGDGNSSTSDNNKTAHGTSNQDEEDNSRK